MVVTAAAEHPFYNFGGLRYLVQVDIAESSMPEIDVQALFRRNAVIVHL
jgi:hypothetical protein